ncbi:MAG: hypothetical protein OEW18_05990 [Candidatus Aminicenantes bacterium]|nr:hypothetical protein [Candidatus Aminicenantes bacterium]
MAKRVMAWITLAAFLGFSWSCAVYSVTTKSPEAMKSQKRAAARISAVQLKSGEMVRFNKKPAAWVQGDKVVGERFVKNISVEKSNVQHMKIFRDNAPTEISTNDGSFYRVDRILIREGTRIYFDGYIPFSILLSEVDLVWIKKVDIPGTLLLDIGIPAALTAAVLIAYSAAWRSFLKAP